MVLVVLKRTKKKNTHTHTTRKKAKLPYDKESRSSFDDSDDSRDSNHGALKKLTIESSLKQKKTSRQDDDKQHQQSWVPVCFPVRSQ